MSKLSQWLDHHFKDHKVSPPPSPFEPLERPAHPRAAAIGVAVSDEEIEAGKEVLRAVLVETGYSSFVSDNQVENLVTKVLMAAVMVRSRTPLTS